MAVIGKVEASIILVAAQDVTTVHHRDAHLPQPFQQLLADSPTPRQDRSQAARNAISRVDDEDGEPGTGPLALI